MLIDHGPGNNQDLQETVKFGRDQDILLFNARLMYLLSTPTDTFKTSIPVNHGVWMAAAAKKEKISLLTP